MNSPLQRTPSKIDPTKGTFGDAPPINATAFEIGPTRAAFREFEAAGLEAARPHTSPNMRTPSWLATSGQPPIKTRAGLSGAAW